MFRHETPRPKLAVGTRVIFSRIKDIEKNGMFATIVKNDLTYPKMYEVLTHGGGYYSTEPNEVYVNKKLLKRWPSTPQVNSIREKLEE